MYSLRPTQIPLHILAVAFTAVMWLYACSSAHAQDELVTLELDDLTRTALVYVPDNVASPAPVVLCLHGYTNNAVFQMEYSALNTVADEAGFVAVYPQGEPDELGINHWNADFDPSDVDDLAFLEALLDLLEADYDADPQRLYSCGFSNGGMMSYALACAIPDRIAAVASVAGTMPDNLLADCVPSQPVPTMHIHGDLDLIVPYNGGGLGEQTGFGSLSSVEETVEFWSNTYAACQETATSDLPNTSLLDLCTVTKTVHDACVNGAEYWNYTINGGGHTWPGAFPLVVVGSTNQDIDASAEIWEFFQMHPLQSVENIASSEAGYGSLRCYPNPTSTALTISTTTLDFSVIHIRDLIGNIVHTERISQPEHTILLSDIPSGMYTVQLGLLSERIVIQH